MAATNAAGNNLKERVPYIKRSALDQWEPFSTSRIASAGNTGRIDTTTGSENCSAGVVSTVVRYIGTCASQPPVARVKTNGMCRRESVGHEISLLLQGQDLFDRQPRRKHMAV
ncbi:hypothetical protein ABID21_003938 [Pseudorhizobium tarimense]|uniref:Uncharacterized protein n=1 Tax=Pseudorhizobium tarimense TaxID=1079109 RepID=A0ABV2HBM4_9HYPH